MSDTSGITNTINSNIFTNNAGKITAVVLNGVLASMVAWVATQYTPHVGSLAALRSFTSIYASTVVRDGYAVAGDAPPLTYTWNATCPGTPDNKALYVQPASGGAGCWVAAADPQIGDVREWGAVCDGANLAQAGVQAAVDGIAPIGRPLHIPGVCVVSGLTMTKPLKIVGDGPTSQIMLASGSTAPALTITIPSTAPGVLGGWVNVSLEDLVITSPNRNDAQKALEHGISITNGSPSVVTNLTLKNVDIIGIPGDGLHLTAFSGYVEMIGSRVLLPGQNGLYCNSSTDTSVHGGAFYGAEQSNWLLSGCTNTKIIGANEFNALQNGVTIFNSTDVVLENVTIDEADRHSISITNTDPAYVVTIIGGMIRWAGQGGGGSYYDIISDAGNLGKTNLIGVHFPTPASNPNSNKAAANVGFYNSSSAPINCFNCVFDLGPIGTFGITNSATGQLFSGTPQTLTVDSSAQFTGLVGFNGTNYAWKLLCSAIGCDTGALQLLAGGVVGLTLLATGESTIPALKLSGIPTSAGSGGLYVCVDSAGSTYKKATCP